MKIPRTVVCSALLVLSGCSFAKIEETMIKTPPQPVAGAKVRHRMERAERPGRLSATASGAGLDVSLVSTTECRNVELVPMQQERTIQRTINGAYGYESNASPQFWNVVTALTVGGAGAVALSRDCSESGSVQGECSQATYTAVGGVMLGLASVAVVAFVTNAIRAADTTEVVRVGHEARPGPWVTCAMRPLSNVAIGARIGSSELVARTGSDGHAYFDLADVHVNDDEAPTKAHLWAGTAELDVDLRSTPAYARWVVEASKRKREKLRAQLDEALTELSRRAAECDADRDARARRQRRRELARTREPIEHVRKHCTPIRERHFVSAQCRDANDFIRSCKKPVLGDVIDYRCPTSLDPDVVAVGLAQLGLSSQLADDRRLASQDAACDALDAERSRLLERMRELDESSP